MLFISILCFIFIVKANNIEINDNKIESNNEKKNITSFFNLKGRKLSLNRKKSNEKFDINRPISEPIRPKIPLPIENIEESIISKTNQDNENIYEELDDHEKIKQEVYNYANKVKKFKKSDIVQNKISSNLKQDGNYAKKLISLDYEIPLNTFSDNKKKGNNILKDEPQYLTIIPEELYSIDECFNKQKKTINKKKVDVSKLHEQKENKKNKQEGLNHVYKNVDNYFSFSSDLFCLKNDLSEDYEENRNTIELFKKIDISLKNIMKLLSEVKNVSFINKNLYMLICKNYKCVYHIYTSALIDYNLNFKYSIEISNLYSLSEELEKFLHKTLQYNNFANKFKTKLQNDENNLSCFY